METISVMLVVLAAVAALGCGMVAGIFLPFSSFTMDALVRLPAARGMAAMQAINLAVARGYRVTNGWFGTVFIGTGVVCGLVAGVSLMMWGHPGAAYRLFGSLLYLAGPVLVTVVFNVPLNEALAVAAPESAEGTELWAYYTTRWTAWNHVRVLTALGAAVLLAVGLGFALA